MFIPFVSVVRVVERQCIDDGLLLSVSDDDVVVDLNGHWLKAGVKDGFVMTRAMRFINIDDS